MRQQIQLWGSRAFVVALIVIAGQRWGMPLYKQYFTPKKVVVYVPTTKVRMGTFTDSFHEIGNLKAERSVSVITEAGGKIISLIQEGKTVVTGLKLVELDTIDLTKDVRNQELNYENVLADVDRAKAELEILKESNKTELEQAEAQLNFDQTELERAKKNLERKQRLATDKLVPLSEVEQAELDVRSKELSVLKGTKAQILKKKEVQSKEQQKVADVSHVDFRAKKVKYDLEEAFDAFDGVELLNENSIGISTFRYDS